jgi:hypothetical protein
MENFEILGGKVQLYRRSDSSFWWCATRLGGKQRRKTTKKESLQLAEVFATDWYLTLQGKLRTGDLDVEKTFDEAADIFLTEYRAITKGQRSAKWTEGHEARLRLHLRPFFGKTPLSKINAGMGQDYRVHRMEAGNSPRTGKHRKAKAWPDRPQSSQAWKTPRRRKASDTEEKPVKPPARSTLHDEFVTLNLVLKAAARRSWLEHLPDLSAPYNLQTKIVHRPWFSPEEYKLLYETSRENARNPGQPQYKWHAEQLHDLILFIGNTGLRPDEIGPKNLLHRDVTIVTDHVSGQRILEIEVRGKRGVGYCKSMPGAVHPYERLLSRPKPTRGKQKRNRSKKHPNPPLELEYPKPTDPLFPQRHTKMLNELLAKADLKMDRDGKLRTAYSLRHTYICLRLMEGADIYQVAKNCRTSVEMIEKHYAAHIKDMIDASAVNVVRSKAVRAAEKKAKEAAKQGEDVARKSSRPSGAARFGNSRDAERVPSLDHLVSGELTAET